MALHFWSVGEAHDARSGASQSDAVGYAAGLLTWLLAAGVFIAGKFGAARAGALLYTQLVFTAFLAWLILGEAIAWYHYFGGGLIVAGIVLVTLFKPKIRMAV